MKKTSIGVLIFLIQCLILNAQTPPPPLNFHARGMYVDRFFKLYGSSGNVDEHFTTLGYTAKETELLEYAKKNHITYLLLYDMYPVMNNLSTTYNLKTVGEHLCSFMERAKNDYCIKYIGVAGASSGFFQSIADNFPTAAVAFNSQELTDMGPGHPLLAAQNTYSSSDSMFVFSELCKFFLRVANFNTSNAARFGAGSGPPCNPAQHFDVITTEYEFWNNGKDESGNRDPIQKYPNLFQPLVESMAFIKKNVPYSLAVETYLGLLDNVTSDDWTIPCPFFQNHQLIADWIDGAYEPNLKRVDRLLTTYYSTGYDQNIYNANNYSSCVNGDFHTLGYYGNRFRDFCSALIPPEPLSYNSNLIPLFESQSFFYDWIGIGGGGLFLGDWFSQGPSNNIWKVEKDFYDNWYNDNSISQIHDAQLKNDIVPGAAQWFSSPSMIAQDKFQNPFLSNSPVCSGVPLSFTYQGPLETGYNWDFVIVKNSDLSIAYSSPSNSWSNYTPPISSIVLPASLILADGEYTAYLTLRYDTDPNCQHEFSLPIQVGAGSPTIDLLASSNSVCAKLPPIGYFPSSRESIILQALSVPSSPPPTYNWSVSGSGATITSTGNICIFDPPIIGGTTASTYTVTCSITGTTGCNYTQSKVLTVNPNPLYGVAQTCTGTPGTEVTLAVNSGNQSACSFEWCDGSTNPTLVVTESGNYSVEITQTNGGCKSLISYHVGHIPILVPTVTPLNTAYCVSNVPSQVTFTVSNFQPAVSYQWFKNGSLLVDQNGETYIDLSPPTTAGTTYYNVVATNGTCTFSASIPRPSVTVYSLPTVTASSTPTSICPGTSSVLSATGGTSYVWQPGSLIGNNLSVSPIANTYYTVTATDANTCSSTATTSVTMNPVPTVSITGSSSICEGGSLGTSVTGTISNYKWYQSNVLIPGAGSNTYIPLVSGSYSVQVTNSFGCTATSTPFSVTLYQKVITSAGVNQQVCAGSDVNLNGSISGGTNNGTWTTSGTGNFNLATSPITFYTPSASDIALGSFVLTLTSIDPAGPCNSTSSSINITIDLSCCGNYTTTINQTDFNQPNLPTVSGILYANLNTSILLNQNIVLTTCTLEVGSNYSITIPSGVTMTINNSSISACGNMWKGIDVQPGGHLIINNSTIADAEIGVLMRNTTSAVSVLGVNLGKFQENFIGIKVEPDPLYNFNTIQMSIEASQFICPGNLKPSNNITVGTKTYAGIYLSDWNGSVGLPGSNGNDFSNLNIGIFSRRCILTDYYSDFSQIYTDPIYPFSVGNGTGIYAVNNGRTGYLHKIGNGKNSTSASFKDCWQGVFSQGVPSLIEENFMDNVYHGVILWKLPKESGSTVVNNRINCIYDGIISQYHEDIKYLTIYINDIVVNNTTGENNYGVGIGSYDYLGRNVRMWANNIEINNGQYGIQLQGVGSHLVFDNNVDMTSTSAIAGVYTTKSDKNKISCNDVIGITGNTDERQYGYYFGISQKNEISCNYVSDVNYGVQIDGVCNSEENFIGNTMRENWIGLSFNNDGVIGLQTHRGNKWDPGTFASSNEAVNPVMFLLSIFKVNPLDPIIFNPSIPIPPSGWFVTDFTGNAFDCPRATICGQEPGGGGGDPKDFAKAVATDQFTPVEFPIESKWIARNELYKKIKENPEYLLDADLQLFYDNNANSIFDKFADIKVEAGDIEEISPNDSTILSDNDSLLKQTVVSIENCEKAFGDGTISYSQYVSTISSLKQIINGISLANKQIMDDLKIQKDQKADDIRTLNSYITATEDYEINEKFVNELVHKTVAKDTLVIDSLDQSQLLSIAHQCPFLGGPSVYLARNLYRLVNAEETYDDYSLCHAIGLMRKRNIESHNLFESFVYPNPTNLEFTLAYSLNSDSKTQLMIYDNSLRLVRIEELNTKERSKKIIVATLAPGLYIYNIVQNNQVISNGKLSIEH